MIFDVKFDIQRLGEMMNKSFDEHRETGLHTLIFHLLDHVVNDLKELGSLHVLTSSPLERYNGHIKSAYCATSRRPHRKVDKRWD